MVSLCAHEYVLRISCSSVWILQSRAPSIFLFASLFVSDGGAT